MSVLGYPALSRREREILSLLVQRLTDPEMADRLFVSRRTVGGHVASIFNKLGVHSRRDAAALAAADLRAGAAGVRRPTGGRRRVALSNAGDQPLAPLVPRLSPADAAAAPHG